jgi:hypothetical protein
MRGALLKWTKVCQENLFGGGGCRVEWHSERGDIIYQIGRGHWFILRPLVGIRPAFKHPWVAIRAVEASLRDPLSEFTRKVARS